MYHKSADYIVSNHRNHGHYLAFTEDYYGLIHELKGTKNGVTMGRGGSQVIFGDHFIWVDPRGCLTREKNTENAPSICTDQGGSSEGFRENMRKPEEKKEKYKER